MTSEKLETAIELIQAGDRQAAVPILRGLIQEDHANEDAWLLLYTCMDEVEHKKFCLQSVLAINPANQEAREALDALTHPAPAPVEIALERTAPEKIERKKMEREQTESERLEQEKAEREKKEQKRLEREKAELERVETLKMEWERTELEQVEKENVEPEKPARKRQEHEKAEAKSEGISKINWDEWDQVEPPVSTRSLKQKPVKVTYQSTPYRKSNSRRHSLFSLLAMMVLFLMLFTVSMVFLAQMIAPLP